VVSLGIFSLVPSDKTMCPEVDSASENEYDKGGRCVWLTTYRPCSAEIREDPGLNLPVTPRATSACRGMPLLF